MSKIVTGKEDNQVEVEQEGMTSTKTSDWEAILSGSQPVVTHKAVERGLQTSITSWFQNAMAQDYNISVDVQIGGNSQIEEIERLKEESDRLLGDVNGKMVMEKLKKTLLEK